MIKRILEIEDVSGNYTRCRVSVGHHHLVPLPNRTAQNARIHIEQGRECMGCGSDFHDPIELTIGQIDSLCEALQDMKLVLEQRLDARGNQ